MNSQTWYKVEEIGLDQQRLENADSKLAPYEIRGNFTYICVLTLTGAASLSYSISEREDYFELRQGMRITMPKGTKSIFVINDGQVDKKLILFLGYKDKSYLIR